MLSDEEITTCLDKCYDAMGWGPDIKKAARAIESAATAPLLARIAELEAENFKLATALNYWKDRCAIAIKRTGEEPS